MTLIICAIKSEAKPFLDALEKKTEEKCASLNVHHGTINGATVMIVCCGVGLEKAAAATQMLIKNYKISRIIMSGTAGGADNELNIGDTEMVLHLLRSRNP